jgi:hypothetical protein
VDDDEGVLRDILRVLPASDQLRRQQRRPPDIAPDEDRKRRIIALSRGGEQPRIRALIIVHAADQPGRSPRVSLQ